MYDVFVELMQKKGVTPYRVSKDTGITQAALSRWKTGKVSPSIETLNTLANYFQVSVDYLLKNGETPPAPARDVSDDDIKFALFKGKDGVTDAMYDEVKAFAEFVKQKYEKG